MNYPTFINYPNTQDADYTYLSFFWNNKSTALSALRKKTDPERIPHKNVDAMANREMCSLLILFLPTVKLILQKGGKDSKRYSYSYT